MTLPQRTALLLLLALVFAALACDSDGTPPIDPGPGPTSGVLPNYPGTETAAPVTATNAGTLGENFFWFVGEYQGMVENIPGIFDMPPVDSLTVAVDSHGDPRHGTITFDGFAPETGVFVPSGTVSITAGGFDRLDDGPTWMRLAFDDVAITYEHGTDDAYTTTFTGELYAVRTAADASRITMNMDALFEGEVYRFAGVELTMDRNKTRVAGRYYEPSEGYLDWTTPQPIEDDECGPKSGLVRGIGATGDLVEIRFTADGTARAVTLWYVTDSSEELVDTLDAWECSPPATASALPPIFETTHGDFAQEFQQFATRRVATSHPLDMLWQPNTYLRVEIGADGARHEMFHHQGQEWHYNGEVKWFTDDGIQYIEFTSDVPDQWGLTFEVRDYSAHHLLLFSPWGEDEGGWEFLFAAGTNNLSGLVLDGRTERIDQENYGLPHYDPLVDHEVALGTWDGTNLVNLDPELLRLRPFLRVVVRRGAGARDRRADGVLGRQPVLDLERHVRLQRIQVDEDLAVRRLVLRDVPPPARREVLGVQPERRRPAEIHEHHPRGGPGRGSSPSRSRSRCRPPASSCGRNPRRWRWARPAPARSPSYGR
jgi:hypothetical protein